MTLYPSTISRRVAAFAVDMIFFSVSAVFIGILTGIFSWVHSQVFWVISGCLVMCFYLFYIPALEALWHGCTVGKYMMGIRVVRTDGAPVTFVHSLQRYLFLIFDLGLTLGIGGLVCAIVTKKKQRLGDIFADTMVVYSKPHMQKYMVYRYYQPRTDEEKAIIMRINPYEYFDSSTPMELAKMHRSLECDIARMRTRKSSADIIDYMERMLTGVHLALFKRKGYTPKELLMYVVRSIPRAVYESRYAIMGSLAIAVIAYAIGVYSQVADPGFFKDFMGGQYYHETMENIEAHNPMGIYKDRDQFWMFLQIFTNNTLVTFRLYVLGIFTLIGPLYMLMQNFIMVGTFDTFFAQNGYMIDALVTPNEHGVIELSSVVMAGGAAIRLGSGWLFPGRMTRLKALAKGARQSLLIMLSTIPMLLIAAIIESFVTRHTEWPMAIKLSIIIASALLILLYYVMLPIISRRHRRNQ